MYVRSPITAVYCVIQYVSAGFLLGILGWGENVGLELKRGGMLAVLVRPLEGGLRFQGGAISLHPRRPLKETLIREYGTVRDCNGHLHYSMHKYFSPEIPLLVIKLLRKEWPDHTGRNYAPLKHAYYPTEREKTIFIKYSFSVFV